MQHDFDSATGLPRPLMATIGVENIELATTAYCRELGYQEVSNIGVSEEYAKIWGHTDLKGRPARLLKPHSGTPVYIRLIECDKDAPAFKNGPGWFALELCVQDSASLFDALTKSDYFSPFAPPTELAFSDKIFPFQCRGHNGEILYLNETRGNLPDIDLPLAKSFVDQIFIVIVGAEDLEKTTQYYCDLLNVCAQESHEFPYKTINRVYDLPLETTHKLNTLGLGRNVFFEIDQTPRHISKMKPTSGVSKGICCVSFKVPRSNSALGSSSEHLGEPYKNAFVQQIYGPDGERIELLSFDTV